MGLVLISEKEAKRISDQIEALYASPKNSYTLRFVLKIRTYSRS